MQLNNDFLFKNTTFSVCKGGEIVRVWRENTVYIMLYAKCDLKYCDVYGVVLTLLRKCIDNFQS